MKPFNKNTLASGNWIAEVEKANTLVDSIEIGQSRDFATDLALYLAFSIQRDSQASKRPSNNSFLEYNNTPLFGYNPTFGYNSLSPALLQ